MLEDKIPTEYVDINYSTIYINDVVEIEKEMYLVGEDKKFHPMKNRDKKLIWSTSLPIKKIGTKKEYPEYFI